MHTEVPSRYGSALARFGFWFSIFLTVAPLADAWALFDNGGHISRQLATGKFVDAAGKSDETVFLAWQGDGSAPNEVTLWAYCGSGDCPPADEDPSCQQPNPPSCAGVVPVKCQDPQGCDYRWKVQLPGSLGFDKSFSPPVTASSAEFGERVYVATRQTNNTGRVYSFDACGNCQWAYDPLVALDGGNTTAKKNTVKNGFYAAPTVHDFTDAGGQKKRVLFAVSWAAETGTAHLHSIKGEGFSGEEGARYRDAIKVAGTGYHRPVVDETCGCVGAAGACDKAAYPRVYVGVVGGDPGAGLYAVDTLSGDAYEVTLAGYENPQFRFGGTILPLGGKRYLLSNLELQQGSIAIALPEAGACGSMATPAVITDVQTAPGVKATHRTRPVVIYEDETPVVYLAQKEDGPGGLIHRFEPNAGPPATVFNLPAENWPWPAACDSVQLDSMSWSTPGFHPYNASLMFGTVKDVGSGVLRVPIDDPCVSTPTDPFFFYRPRDGWRSEGVFTDKGRRFHVGSSFDLVYTLEAEARSCPVVDWCYDMGADAGGRCFVGSQPNPGCCSASSELGAP